MSVKKSPKIQKLVVNAIRKLQDVQGSTSNEISNYISQEYDVPSTQIKRQVNLALARALSYGILQRSKGGYICNRELIGRQPQLFDEEPVDKCRPHGGGGRRRAGKRARSSRKRRRGGASCGSKRRSGRRRGGGRSRKRRGGGSCGPKGKSRRRGGKRGGGKKSRRRSRRGGRGRGGKKCGSGRGESGDENGIFDGRVKRRRARRNLSAVRNENRAASVSPSNSDEEHLDDKPCDDQPIESLENSLD